MVRRLMLRARRWVNELTMLAEKANLKYGSELKQFRGLDAPKKQPRRPSRAVLSLADDSESPAAASAVASDELRSLPNASAVSNRLDEVAESSQAFVASADAKNAFGGGASAADVELGPDVLASSVPSSSASASTRSSGIALSVSSTASDGATANVNAAAAISDNFVAASLTSSNSNSGSATAECTNSHSHSDGIGASGTGSASGGQVPRKSSMKKRTPLPTMASVSEREERERPDSAECDLVTRRPSCRSLAKSLSRYLSF